MKAAPEATSITHLGIFNDYVRIPYANGSSFASQFLYREFKARGAQVTVVGPKDPAGTPEELPARHVLLDSLPFRAHPGLHLPFPTRRGLRALAAQQFSLAVGQTGSAFLEAGVWLRRQHRVPFVCVNTVHLASVYEVILPDSLRKVQTLGAVFEKGLIPWAEAQLAQIYNGSDGLVVLSEGLRSYWRERGVSVPIHVIPRSVEPKIFSREPPGDPYPSWAAKGGRLVVVCRHTREKNIRRLLEIFARHIAPICPKASLALVGDGPEHDEFRRDADELGIAERCIWPGELSQWDIPAWYRHADVFVYTSLSETYGQVVSEALWCGLPAVAFDDNKGVADQIAHESDGYLIAPKSPDSNEEFGAAVGRLLTDAQMRTRFAESAASKARERSDPERCVERYEAVFSAARQHLAANPPKAGTWTKSSPLIGWTLQMALLAGLGCMRAPATVNRQGRLPPPWDLPGAAEPGA